MKWKLSGNKYLEIQNQTIEKMRNPDNDEPVAEPEPEPLSDILHVKQKKARFIALIMFLVIIAILIVAALNDNIAQIVAAAVAAIISGGVYYYAYRKGQ